MNRIDIKNKLIQILTEIFSNSIIDMNILDFVDLIDDLGMDSITFITIVVEVENAFDIIVPDDRLVIENFRTLNDIIQVIESANAKVDILSEEATE